MTAAITLEPDPIKGGDIEVKQIRTGIRHSRYDRPHLHALVYGEGRGNRCEERDPETTYYCTRPKGHPEHWKHIASNGETILAVWDGGPIWVELPEDGTPPDGKDVTVDAPEVGDIYRLRDRKNIMQVIGGVGNTVRSDGRLDVLDLTAQTYRAVHLIELVPTEYEPTAADFKFIATYTNQMRVKTRDAAIAEYHASRWCEAGLQDGLRDLGLPKYVPEQRGHVVIKVPYSGPTDMGTSTAVGAIKDLFKTDELAKLVYPEDNENDLILRVSELSVRVEGVTRQ